MGRACHMHSHARGQCTRRHQHQWVIRGWGWVGVGGRVGVGPERAGCISEMQAPFDVAATRVRGLHVPSQASARSRCRQRLVVDVT